MPFSKWRVTVPLMNLKNIIKKTKLMIKIKKLRMIKERDQDKEKIKRRMTVGTNN